MKHQLFLITCFYKNVVMRNKTVLITDAHLINDTRTISIVQKMMNENGLWQKKFVVNS